VKEVIILGKRREAASPLVRWPGAEFWGVSGSQQRYARKFPPLTDWTSWWDLHHVHKTEFHRGIREQRPRTYEWYKTLPGPESPDFRPLYTLEPHPSIPASIRFPREDVIGAFPELFDDGRFMGSCQVDLMMAYALMKGFEHIILSGHGTKMDALHAQQHKGILYWAGAARAMGVRVTMVAPSMYSAPPKIYGLEMGSWTPPVKKRR